MSENDLKKYIDEFFENLTLYDDYHNGHNYKGLLKSGIDVFLEKETTYNAFEIYQTFLMVYQITGEDKSESSKSEEIHLSTEPNTILDLVKIMKKYEENTGDLIDKQRDHFIHSVNVFLLGIAIYSQNKTYRDIFRNYVLNSPYKKYYKVDDGTFSDEEFLYRWGIAALFHDIGYPVEIIGKQLKKFINDGVKSISTRYEADTAIDFKDFNDFNTIIDINPAFPDKYRKTYPETKFLDLFKPTDIMANKIVLDFPTIDTIELTKHLNTFVNIMGDYGFIDHGFFSAILVLNSYGYLVQKYSKDYDFFFYPIVDSATAIVLHNYYRNVLMKKPFNLEGMDPRQSPLSYLLILCDELQEWNRQPFGVKDKQRSHINELELEIDENKLSLKYIVHSGSMGLGFSEEKEDFLRKVLKIRSIFQEGLTITTIVEQDNVMREIIKSEIEAPDILLRNVEKIAIEVHDQYNQSIEEEYANRYNIIKKIEEKLQKANEKAEELHKKLTDQGNSSNILDVDIKTYKEWISAVEEVKNLTTEKNKKLDEIQEKYDNRIEFNQLSSHFKIANIRQARSIPKKLNMIGCELAPKSDTREEIKEFKPDEIVDLAIVEHDDWCDEKRGTGWTYGEEKDVENLITPYLIPWEDLEENIQQYDVDAVKNIPHLVDEIGLKIVRTRVRLLTFKMHEFYNRKHNVKEFDKLPEYIKYSNYKQADFLVKILGELHYHVVSKDTEGEAIKYFDGEILEYLAKREHDAWYKLRINLGWKYGKQRDDKLKLNPNLVPWEELDEEHKNTNKFTFENLPTLCDEVGLKIIKD